MWVECCKRRGREMGYQGSREVVVKVVQRVFHIFDFV